MYDTKIIKDNTFQDLLNLMYEYPISITNEQVKPLFKQIKISNDQTYFYDYLSRNENYKYIMLKLY